MKNRIHRAMDQVDGHQVEGNPRVVAAKKDLATAEQAHSSAAKNSARLDTILARIDESLSRGHVKLGELRDLLPPLSARVLLGEATPSQEGDLLERIADLERVLTRGKLGRPIIDARIRESRSEIRPLADAVTEKAEVLERARRDVQEQLARVSVT